MPRAPASATAQHAHHPPLSPLRSVAHPDCHTIWDASQWTDHWDQYCAWYPEATGCEAVPTGLGLDDDLLGLGGPNTLPGGSALKVGDVQTTATALAAAAKQQPTSIAVDASSGWQLYGGGTMSGQCGTSLDHGVLLVGHTPDYWIVKNSWADTWGIDGYIHLSRSDCASQKGECGLYADASFPLTGAALPKYEDLPTMTRVSADFLAKKN